jgi:hypothetical protein
MLTAFYNKYSGQFQGYLLGDDGAPKAVSGVKRLGTSGAEGKLQNDPHIGANFFHKAKV